MTNTSEAFSLEAYPTSDPSELERKYRPQLTETYVAEHLDRMYSGKAPTINEARALWGDAQVSAWIADMIQYMFALSTANDINASIVSNLVSVIKVECRAYKLTEFMHFVYLFRSGTYKTYGRNDGRTAVEALKEYAKYREGKLTDIRSHTDTAYASSVGEYSERRQAMTPSARAMMRHCLEDLQGESWRSEPWSPLLARWFFNEFIGSLQPPGRRPQHTLQEEVDNFPGNWTPEQRYNFALRLGYNPYQQQQAI